MCLSFGSPVLSFVKYTPRTVRGERDLSARLGVSAKIALNCSNVRVVQKYSSCSLSVADSKSKVGALTIVFTNILVKSEKNVGFK